MNIIEADLDNAAHCAAVADLVSAYASDPMGRDAPLPPTVRRELAAGLRDHGGSIVFLAYDAAKPVGVAVCFIGYSSFAARPLLNIHDIAVLRSHRRRGVGRLLLASVEAKARALGCCKLTLEVRQDNLPAQQLYRAIGFDGDDPPTLFWTKKL